MRGGKDSRGRGLLPLLSCCTYGVLWLACSSDSAQSGQYPEPGAALTTDPQPPVQPLPKLEGEMPKPAGTAEPAFSSPTGPAATPPLPDSTPAQNTGPSSAPLAPPTTNPQAGGQGGAPSVGAPSAGTPSASPGSSAMSPSGAPTGAAPDGPSPEPVFGTDGFPVECVEQLPLAATSDTRFPVTVKLEIENTPLVFGEENALSGGGTVIPTNLRFYLSQFTLLRGEERVPVFPTGPDGQVLPYGVHLANAEEETSLSFELTAPAGPYDGVSFLVGLSPECNAHPTALNPPLDQASQLKWPHLQGFLFLRYEGLLSDDAVPALPSVHMGAAIAENGGAPRVTVEMPIEGTIGLRMDFGAFLQAAGTETELTDAEGVLPSAEIIAGERGRRALRDQSAVVFLPPAAP